MTGVERLLESVRELSMMQKKVYKIHYYRIPLGLVCVVAYADPNNWFGSIAKGKETASYQVSNDINNLLKEKH